MKPQSDYWRSFWNEQARHASSDHSLNRQTGLRLEALEREAAAQFLAAVSPQPTDIVLDAGCGSGCNLSMLSPRVKELVGVDYSDEMVLRARARVAAEGLGNVKLMQGDILNLPFPANSFDKVVCTSVLQYLDDEDCALAIRRLAQVCKPGGTLVLHVKNGSSLYGLSLKVLRMIAPLVGKHMKPEFYRSRRWHERSLSEAGGVVMDREGFGLLHFVPLPAFAVRCLLLAETRLPIPKFFKQFAVNYKLTVRMDRSAGG